MNVDLQSISYSAEAPYYTVGSLNEDTQVIWITCHGIGQRAQYFVRKFEGLLQPHHFLIAPQGLSRFYMHDKFERVGASWMTRDYREIEIANQGRYLDAIILKELGIRPWERYEINLLGFSQGVATITRWALSRPIPFKRLVLWAGGFPHEIHTDFSASLPLDTEVWSLIGDEDPYINGDKIQAEQDRLNSLFGKLMRHHVFQGAHEIKPAVLRELFFHPSDES